MWEKIAYEDQETKKGEQKTMAAQLQQDCLEGIASLPEGSLPISDTISFNDINVLFQVSCSRKKIQ